MLLVLFSRSSITLKIDFFMNWGYHLSMLFWSSVLRLPDSDVILPCLDCFRRESLANVIFLSTDRSLGILLASQMAIDLGTISRHIRTGSRFLRIQFYFIL